MKIIGFSQLRNELSKGNLENWFKSMEMCEYIYIFDQASDDGSHDVYAQHDNAVVIQSKENLFRQEILCKKELLEKLLLDHPDADWIFWMDGDTVLDQRLLNDNYAILKDVLDESTESGADAIKFGHYNLWRSNRHYRVDSSYHSLDQFGVVPFWKNNGRLNFSALGGLHNAQYPNGMSIVAELKHFKMMHYGFSTDKQIIDRYNLYKGLGQSGWDLDRLICERDLQVRQCETELLPTFIDSTTPDPTTLATLKDLYGLLG
tara:strand:- start:491 stop:1273 length:783 start_codon:yes stop_codon:yes gene_type:complete